jgi:2-oxoglutarate ferredoxin oxidoreductase subunit alpha
MIYGAAGSGARAMTSSSSPGVSLKQEGISYIACAELPCLIVNMVRSGPGLGGIQPSQGDYFQATRGGGHGDYYMPVLAPASVQEAVELTQLALDLADMYRTPAMLLGDGLIGQMMEPVEMPDYKPYKKLPEKTWAATGWDGKRERAIINSLIIEPDRLEKHLDHLNEKWNRIRAEECRWQEEMTEDAEIVIAAYGTTARVCRSAMRMARAEGIKVGLLRPITLWPFPYDALSRLADTADKFLTVEMSLGQMVEDVRLAVNGKKPVEFYGRYGGVVPTVREVFNKIKAMKEGK